MRRWGATLAHAAATDRARLSVRERALLGAAAVAFPDLYEVQS
jgi:hypothetical protein